MSKARLVSDAVNPAAGISAFVYRGVPPNCPEAPASLPTGTEMLWVGNAQSEELPPQQSAGQKYTDASVEALQKEAWQKGFDQAAANAQENLEKALSQERSNVAQTLSEFAEGRQAYYERIEGEVIRLVLAIARKVLHREAQVDPMLLAGVVRVALEKIAGGASVRLRVPVEQEESWKEAVRSFSARDLRLTVEGDELLSGPHCVIVSDLGTTDVSLDAQLVEIEHGFLDLLAEHPPVGKAGTAGQD